LEGPHATQNSEARKSPRIILVIYHAPRVHA
jgi:hypothetical protein